MSDYFKHFKIITKHKIVVGFYCSKMGLYWQGFLHDLSKYSFREFFTSAKYFQGASSPIDSEKKALGYSYAWQNHHNKNPHHWEYWTDFKNGQVYGVKVPFNYVLEMVADYIGAGKIYGGKNWNQHAPLEYYYKTKESRVYHQETDALLLFFFKSISKNGLKYVIKDIRKNKKIYKKQYNKGGF